MCYPLNQWMDFDQTFIDTLLGGREELIDFGDLDLIFKVTSYKDYKSVISAHYLPNQWFNFSQMCIDILLGGG